MRNTRNSSTLICILLLLTLFCSKANADSPWTTLEPGLELGVFYAKTPSLFSNGEIKILRVDPDKWNIKLYTRLEHGHKNNMSAQAWSKHHNLTAVINAGMFLQDLYTHVGYLQVGDLTQSTRIKRYKSLAAFSPKINGAAPFRIFDLDEKDTDFDLIANNYEHVVQNLRLIKRPGHNQWRQQEKRWNEAALGEDKQGRALFIYSRSLLSMHDLNDTLLSLPIDLVAAQHLEGGKDAQLYINHPNHQEVLANSFSNPFLAGSNGLQTRPIPNVIGITRKTNVE